MLKNRTVSIAVACVGLVTLLTVGFNNCGGKATFSNPYDESTLASSDAGNYLLGLLEEAKKIEATLLEQADVEATAQASELRKFIDNVELLISADGDNLPVDHKKVLDQRDYLVNSMAKGRELMIVFKFNDEIDRLDAEDLKLRNSIAALDLKFSTSLTDLETRIKTQITNITVDIQTQITNIKNEYSSSFEAFKNQVEVRFNAMNVRIGVLEDRVQAIEASINALNVMLAELKGEVKELRTTTETAVAALKSSLEALKENTEKQIAHLKELNNELNQKLVEQNKAFDAYVNAQTLITSVQARMCKLDVSTGKVASSETVCASQEDVENGQCCLTADTVNCSMLFPEDTTVAEAARSQCSNILVTVKNHEALVAEIAENEAEQNALIDKLVADVKNLNDRMTIIEDGMSKLTSIVDGMKNSMASVDARLMVLEFKAARSEAVATLHERSDLYLAWLARRKMDVQHRFCNANSETAFNMSDYESAKHNWSYCAERLAWLNQAHELVQLAKAYGEGALSTNVDKSCTLVVSGKNVEAMTPSELLVPTTSQQVISKCTSGSALVLTLIGNIIRLQNKIGPDFRTAEYMATKAKIGQIVYFGTLVSQAGTAAIQAFENVDPTSDALKDTYYGRIERVFKNRYVETRLRTSNGSYPLDPSKFAGSVAGFNLVYTEADIKAAATPYMARLKALEIESACGGNCGFKVTRSEPNGVVASRIGSRFSFPKDASTKCPIIDDTVMVKSTDDKHYAYSLNYTRYKGATEVLLPRLRYANNNHNAVASSTANAQAGQFLGCGYRVRHIVDRFGIPDALLRGRHVLRYGRPYAKSHGLPQCQRFHFSCHLWAGTDNKGEWIAPNNSANVLHYLSGFDNSKIETMCKVSGASYVAKTRDLMPEETNKIYVYKSNIATDGVTQAVRNAVTSSTTQLTKNYWVLQDAAAQYGYSNVAVSQASPFYVAAGSTSEHFLRGLVSMSQFAPAKVQQCYDPK
ncbi:MAG: hypothetical protein IT287_02925 [Bdellovibrionaceae bacterium]|nr:hypothetical protein [Pseudobdellovibrionaceae bacterium]